MHTASGTPQSPVRYLPPSRGDRVMNRTINRLTRMGLSVWGSRELRVVGRRSGEVRSTVVNLLTIDGQRYLVSPRGTTDWVRNLRAAGRGDLRVGRRSTPFAATEVANEDKVDVLRTYLVRWAFEVGRFFEGVDADSGDEALAEIAPGFPVFSIDE